MLMATYTYYLLYAKLSSKCFTYIKAFHPHNYIRHYLSHFVEEEARAQRELNMSAWASQLEARV